jgi:ABC-type transport system substrate-binding protein
MRLGRVGVCALALALIATTACTSGQVPSSSSPAGRSGGTLRVGMEEAPFFTMDPARDWNTVTWELFRCCLLRTLMSYDVSGNAATLDPVPDLAAAPPDVSLDGLTWTFHLRPGLRYAPPLQDVEITSADFVRALLRLAKTYGPSKQGLGYYLREVQGWDDYAARDATSVVGLQTPDPHTLRIVETYPDASLPYVLSMPMSAPIPPRPGSPDDPFGVATGHDEGDAGPTPLGGYGQFLVASGPYMVEGADGMDLSLPPKQQTPAPGFDPWILTDKPECCRTTHWGSLTFVRNPSWDPADDPLRTALPDRIEIRGGEASRLFRRMAAGDLDLVFDEPPPPSVLHRYRTDPELQPLIQTPEGAIAIRFASFNVAVPPFDDVAVRRAIAFALDRASLTNVFRRWDNGADRVADHFAPDTYEASLLAGRSVFPGGGKGDVGAAREALAGSGYAAHGRCVDPACHGISVLVDARFPAAVPIVRRSFGALGMSADVRLGDSFECSVPRAHVAFCIGQGWIPDFPSAAGYLAAFFASDGTFTTTRLGARPDQLRRWGYDVTSVPSVDAAVGRCAQEVGSTQPTCWARLDQYIVSQLMPAVPISFLGRLLLSSPSIGPFPWDEVTSQPALDRIEAPVG